MRGMMHVVLLRSTAALVLAACSNSSTGTSSPYTVTVKSGDAQTDSVKRTLPQSVSVTVTDKSNGYPAPGITVNWNVTAGGGSVTATSATDAGGVASATWTLGPVVGTQHVQASVSGGTPVTFTATALGPVPVFVASVPIPPNYGIHSTYVRDGMAFVCAWNTGVLIYDVGNGIKGGSPANPTLVGSVATTGGRVHNAWWFHNPVTSENRYLFVGQEGLGTIGTSSSGDIHVVDVSNLAAPVEVASFHMDSAGTHNFWMDEPNQILYAAYYNGGVVAIDVSGTLSGDISSRLITKVKPGGAGNTYTWGVQLHPGGNDSLYAIDMLSGLWQLHTAGGTLSVTSGGNNVPNRYSSDFWVTTGYIYTGSWDWARRTNLAGSLLKVWQLDGAGHPSPVDSILTDSVSAVSDVKVSVDGKLLLFSTEGGSYSGFWFYSLADPAHPTYTGYYAVSTGIHTVTFATINGRLYAFGAKDPASPALIILDVTGLDQ